jgi:hypothetical protein
VDLSFELRRGNLEAEIKQNHGNQTIIFELFDANGNLIARAQNGDIELSNLPLGSYVYRVRGNVSKAVDFTIKSKQAS